MTLTRITQRYQQQRLASSWAVFLGSLLLSPAATGQPITPAPDGTETAVTKSLNVSRRHSHAGLPIKC